MANNIGQYWSMTEGVFNCLIDEERSLAFKRAIQNTVSKDDIVVDMGTGSGILAIFAAKAGARKVYAVEIDKNNVKTLEKTFAENGVADVVTVIHADVTSVVLPEKVDVVIGEMIATGLIEELQVHAMNNVLRYTNRNFKVLLNYYETFIDLVYNNENYYGCKFKILRYEYPDLDKLRSTEFSKKYSIDKVDFSKPRKHLIVSGEIPIKILKTGTINGIRISGETTFYDGSKLGGTFAYDYPLILPINETCVRKGQVLIVKIKYRISGGMQKLTYSIQ
jgi:predicted RNA methylase